MDVINKETGKNFWIGADDLGREGTFRMLNGTKFEVGRNSLYDWYTNNPDNNNGIEDCVHIWTTHNSLNDADCTRYDNYDRDGKDFHGLCEIPEFRCIPN